MVNGGQFLKSGIRPTPAGNCRIAADKERSLSSRSVHPIAVYFRVLVSRNDRNINFSAALGLELDRSFALGKNCVVLADTDTLSRVPFGAALAHDNIARDNAFTTILFYAKTATG